MNILSLSKINQNFMVYQQFNNSNMYFVIRSIYTIIQL